MPPKKERRLDSLARLLEGNHTCAAVCVYENKIYAATNDPMVKESTRDRFADLWNELKKPLVSVTKFKDAVLTSVKASSKGQGLVLNDDEILGIAESFVRGGFKAWEDTTIGQLKKTYKTHTRLSSAVMIYSLSERLATDFLKVRKEILDNNPDNLIKKNIEFEALPTEEDVHAEMTIITKLLEKGVTEPVYIGISKKCCDECKDVIKAVNEVLAGKVKVKDSEEEIPKIDVSGSHPQQPKNWAKPSFLTRTDGIYAEIKAKYEEITKDKAAVKKAEEEVALKSKMLKEAKSSKTKTALKKADTLTTELKEKKEELKTAEAKLPKDPDRSHHDMIPERSDSPPPSPSKLKISQLAITGKNKAEGKGGK